MADFNYFLNRQGPRGMQGEKGEQGADGRTPTFYAGVDSGTQYTLIIDMGDGNTFETSNLMPTFINTGGTYLRYDAANSRYVSAQADMADLNGNTGEVRLATTSSVANETVEDSDAVSYELFRQSGGGGGTSFTPGNGLELTTNNILNVKVDNSTVTFNASGELVANGGGGGGTSYSAGTGIDITNNTISIDSSTFSTIGSAVQSSDLGTLAFKNSVDYTLDITNKPTLGSLSSKNTVDYDTDVTNKPTIGAGIITFTQGTTTLGTIDVNQTSPTTINIPSSGGGGGSTYAAGNGIEISVADVISAKVDNSTIGFSASGELELKATIPTDTSDLTNGAGYITGITSGDVTTALGYTPYSSANPNGYTTNVGTVTSVNNSTPDSNGNVTLSIPAAQVQADWNEADNSSKAYILNKPTIPDVTNMVTTNTTQSITGTKTFGTGNLKITDLRLSDDSKVIEDKGTYVYVGSGGITTKIKSNNTKLYFNGSSGIDEEMAKVSQLPGDMTGAGASTAGTHGLVPAPTAGDNEKFLRGDGTWQTVSGGGSATDVQVNGVSITSSDVANIVTEGVYDSSTNKIATMSDVPTSCISGSEVSSPLEYTTSTIGVQKFNYTGSTGTVVYSNDYGTNISPPSNTFQYIAELTNGINFIATDYLANTVGTDEVQTIINLGTYSSETFTTIISISIRVGSQYATLYDNSYNELCTILLSGEPTRNNTYEANNKTVFCLSYDASLQKIVVAHGTPNSSNTNSMVYGDLTDVNSTNYSNLVTKLGQCTHIQVAFVNNATDATVTSMNIDNLIFTNPSTSYASSLDTTDVDCLMDAVAVDTNLYTSTVTNHSLVLNYDNSTLDVDNGALKVKDNTFITEASLQTVHCVIETYQDGTSWYRLYDDGWVEQGGDCTLGAFSYTFMIEFASKPNVHLTRTSTSAEQLTVRDMGFYSIPTTTGFTINSAFTTQYFLGANWFACGYAAQT